MFLYQSLSLNSVQASLETTHVTIATILHKCHIWTCQLNLRCQPLYCVSVTFNDWPGPTAQPLVFILTRRTACIMYCVWPQLNVTTAQVVCGWQPSRARALWHGCSFRYYFKQRAEYLAKRTCSLPQQRSGTSQVISCISRDTGVRTVNLPNIHSFIWYLLYLLPAIGLPPGGSSTVQYIAQLHTNNT